MALNVVARGARQALLRGTVPLAVPAPALSRGISAWTGASAMPRLDRVVGTPSTQAAAAPSVHGMPVRAAVLMQRRCIFRTPADCERTCPRPLQVRHRSRAGVPSWKKKAARKADALTIRQAVRFAARCVPLAVAVPALQRVRLSTPALAPMLAPHASFDPMRSARIGVLRTLGRLGWPVNKQELITEGVHAFAALKHMYLVIDVVAADDYFPGTHVLKPDVQAKYDLIRSKGWKVVLVNQRAWEKVALGSKPGGRAQARANLLVSLVTDQAPFETRRDAELVSENDYGVYDKMRRAASKHGSRYGALGIVRGKGRVRMRTRRSRQ